MIFNSRYFKGNNLKFEDCRTKIKSSIMYKDSGYQKYSDNFRLKCGQRHINTYKEFKDNY